MQSRSLAIERDKAVWQFQEHNKTEKQVPIREPDLLIVMTGGTMAYSRPDGVKVIPLACLKD